MTINNNAERINVVGSDKANEIVAGKLEPTGTLDIFIEQGGATEFGWVTGASAANIDIGFGLTAPDFIRFSNATFTSIELPANNSDAVIVSGLPFIAEDVFIY